MKERAPESIIAISCRRREEFPLSDIKKLIFYGSHNKRIKYAEVKLTNGISHIFDLKNPGVCLFVKRTSE